MAEREPSLATARPRSGRRLPGLALRAGALLLAGAVLVELGLFVYVACFRSPVERFDLASGTFELRPGRYPGPPEPVVVNSKGFFGAEFQDPPPPGTLRIVALGDSCTVGSGGIAGHYPAELESILNESQPVSVQVINAGIDGLTSRLALRRLRSAVIPLEPDLVTLYLGWNDLMKLNPRAQSANPGLALPFRALDHLWTVRALRKLAFYHVRVRHGEPAVGPGSRTGRFAGYEPEVFGRNLRRMVSMIHHAGATPALLTLPTVITPETSVADLRWAYAQFPYFEGGNAAGDFLDLVEGYNRSIRRVADADGAVLVDLERAMARASNRRDLFLDNMHLTDGGHRFVARVLVRSIREAGWPASVAGSGRVES